jgi:REP element-mobilizing transposase RayT
MAAMARPIRIERAGAWYHVTARGNERRDIYRQEDDRRHFCALLAEMVERFQVVMHGYVLMDNHCHLLLEPRQANLSQAIQWLNVSYSIWFNRRHGRSGHLFQGRFKSVIVQEREWGLGVSRYIHLNPVRTGKLGLNKSQQQRIRAGAAGKPEGALVRERIAKLRGYRWSSYRSYIGAVRAPEWLECGSVLRLGGGRLEEQRRNYRNYVEGAVREGVEKSPWEELKEQVVLGSQEFVAGLRKHLAGDEREQRGVRRLRDQRPDVSEVVRCVEEAKGEKWEAFRDRHGDGGRDMVLYLGRQLCGAKLNDLARLAGLKEYAAVAMAIKRFMARLAGRKGIPEEWQAVNQMLHVKM